MANKTLIWSKTAVLQFRDIVMFVSQDSSQNAEKLKNDVLVKVDTLMTMPEKYRQDKYKLNNDGSYRAFEVHHVRIAYRITNTEIRILRIRHTSMEPKNY